MGHVIVKITHLESGEKIEDPKWCLLVSFGMNTSRVLCSGDAIDASSNYTVKSKEVKKNGVTCPYCLAIIEYFEELKIS